LTAFRRKKQVKENIDEILTTLGKKKKEKKNVIDL